MSKFLQKRNNEKTIMKKTQIEFKNKQIGFGESLVSAKGMSIATHMLAPVSVAKHLHSR